MSWRRRSQAQPRPGAADDVADRLAGVWAMMAELDPELARRLVGYQAMPD